MTFTTFSPKERHISALVRSDGTGVHKDGTGVHKDGTGIHKDGTGIGKFVSVMLFAITLFSATNLFAIEISANDMNIQVRDNNVFVTLFNEGELYVGRGFADGPYSIVILSRVEFGSPVFNVLAAGSGTGAHAAGSGTGINAAGSGTGALAAGSGTGLKAAGSGTGITAAGSGTGFLAAGSGTGITAAGSGTGAQAAGSGTGANAAGSGTGSNAAGSGTGFDAAGSGTGGNAAGSGTGGDAAGSGTGQDANNNFSIAVEVALGCNGTDALVYNTVNLDEIGHFSTGMPSLSSSVCSGQFAYDSTLDVPNNRIVY